MEALQLCYHGETATGKHPVECVNMMNKIAENIENEMDHWTILNRRTRNGDVLGNTSDLIIGHALCEVAMQTEAKAIFSLSAHGNTPKAISAFRPYSNIVAVTPNEITARQMNLIWGVTPVLVTKDYADVMLVSGINYAKENNIVSEGDTAVIGGSDTYDYHNSSSFNSYKTIGGICRI